MLDPARKELLDEKLAALLLEFQDVVGPYICNIHNEDRCDCPDENFSVREGWALPVDIALLSLWVDSSESTYLDIYTPERQALTRTAGLLHQSLHSL